MKQHHPALIRIALSIALFAPVSTVVANSEIPAGWFLQYGLEPPNPFDPGSELVCYADPDGDGFTNIEEFSFGSDPLDCDSPFPSCPVPESAPEQFRIEFIAAPTPKFVLTWDVKPNQTYVVEFLPPGANAWQEIATIEEGIYEYEPDLSGTPEGMLRVRIEN